MLAKITIDEEGDVFYYNEYNQFDRLDGPAIEYSFGGKIWCVNGARHRLDGPAVVYSTGDKEWWINDKEYSERQFNKLFGKLC